jgi:hypothetical protein
MAGPTLPTSNGGLKTALLFGGGLLLTIAAVAALVVLWPDDDDGDVVAQITSTTVADGTTTVSGATGEPSGQSTTTVADAEPAEPAQLFEAGADNAIAEMAAAAGGPTQAMQVAVYPNYAFLAYRSPGDPAHIDRRSWRDGTDQDDAAPNPIYDRVDGDTEPRLFPLSAVPLAKLPRLIDDAPRRFTGSVGVTHVLIDRFLPFDERVLIRVYASPTDGRSGGGYVQYTADGSYVKTVQ